MLRRIKHIVWGMWGGGGGMGEVIKKELAADMLAAYLIWFDMLMCESSACFCPVAFYKLTTSE